MSEITDHEEIFIGSILRNPERLCDVKITPEHFSRNWCRQVFEVMTSINASSETVDIVSVSEQLSKQSNDPWLSHLSGWFESAFSRSFFDTSQTQIINRHREDRIKSISHDLNKNLDPDAAIQSLMDLNIVEKRYTHTLKESLSVALNQVKEQFDNGLMVGLPTGLIKINEALGGLHKTDLIVIGARPAMGKTAFVINLMLENGCPVAFFSTEQPADQVALRSLSIEGGVSARRIRSAQLEDGDWPLLTNAVMKAAKKEVYIHDKPSITINEIMREARRLKYNHDIGVIYVDYIQRIKSPSAASRRLEVEDVVKGLKTLARELDVPVVALAQVSREVDKRPNRRPTMGDLLESGAIEQEADTVMLLYRDEAYEDQMNEKQLAAIERGVLEVLIDKNRHGPTGAIKLAWIGDQMKVRNLIREAGNF